MNSPIIIVSSGLTAVLSFAILSGQFGPLQAATAEMAAVILALSSAVTFLSASASDG